MTICTATGKIRYPSPGAAHNAALHHGGKFHRQRKPKRAYRCEACGQWHLTHGEKR